MRLIKPSIEFLSMSENPLQAIELAGRTCYKSEGKITPTSAKGFVQRLLNRGHLAMIEHAWASYRVITDRGVTHEIVRHRLFSYAQESTRYCNYKGGVTFIIPPWMGETKVGEYKNIGDICHLGGYDPANYETHWLQFLIQCEEMYKEALMDDWNPQQARSVLPNALKTEIVITGNLREWRHFFTLRTAKAAHPQMQEIANMLLEDMSSRVPVIFDDIETPHSRSKGL